MFKKKRNGLLPFDTYYSLVARKWLAVQSIVESLHNYRCQNCAVNELRSLRKMENQLFLRCVWDDNHPIINTASQS